MWKPPMLALALVAAMPPSATAEPVCLGDLVIEDAWARATEPGAKVGAAYLVVRNEGDRDDRLAGGEAVFAGRVEVRTMAMPGGNLRLRRLYDGVAVPAGGVVTLEPGGYQLTFIDLHQPLLEGEHCTVRLRFVEAGEVDVDFEVRSVARRR